jgi:5-methylcytosine-specific restriction endonuclease McrA
VSVAQTENGELADLPLDALEDEIATLASHIYAGTCRWLELVAEVDRRGGFGARSTAEWLAWRCALSPRAAREHVRVARCLTELPLIREAFASGELSYAKVRALTRVAEPANEEELLELARHMTASQLERAVRAYRQVTARDADDLHALAYAGYTWEPDGSLIIRARLAPEDGALFVRALEASRDRLQEREWSDEGGSAEPRRPTSAEAFVALAETALAGKAAARSGGDRYQVVVHVEPSGGSYVLEDGPALAPETVERLGCDASLVELVERDGVPLSVGRKTRTIPPAIRRALQARDRRCQFPGCENRRFLHAHHIKHWARGGETTLDNLVLLCPRHHRFVHESGYSIRAIGESKLEFFDPWGYAIPPVPRPPPGNAQSLVERSSNLHIDSETCACGDGDRMDLGLAVDALLAVAGRRISCQKARAGD